MGSQDTTVVILDQASGYLQIDMLEAYGSVYDKRVIIAGTIVERSTTLPQNVKWHKITPYNRSTGFFRVYTWLMASLQMLFIVLFKYRKAHVVAITNPPFTAFIPWMLGCRYDIVIYDLYPDALARYKYLTENSLIYRIWSKLNKWSFSKARKVFAITEGMKQAASKYVKETGTIQVVPLWSDVADFTYVPKEENLILKKTKAKGKFILLYSGNLGKTHPVEKIVEIGTHLDPQQYEVIIIGEGAKKKRIQSLINELKAPHIHLLPWQPADLLSHNLYAADISVVTLDKEASDLSIPSKTFNILSVGNPILAICAEESALGKLVQDYDCGFVTDGKNVQKAISFITHAKENPAFLNSMRTNSKKAAEHFTKSNALSYL